MEKTTGGNYRQLIKQNKEIAKAVNDQKNEYFKALAKLADNHSLTKYDPVDYDLFKSFINQRKAEANDSLYKVKKIEENFKFKKEASMLKQHIIIWLKEWEKLTNQSQNIETEFEDYFKLLEHNSVAYISLNTDEEISNDTREEEKALFESLNSIDQLEDFSKRLNDDRIKFKVRTVLPINDLRDDLKFYLNKNSKNILLFNQQKNLEIINTINTVKDQQENILSRLETDYNKLNHDINDYVKKINQEELKVEEGIPVEAFNLESPDYELKVSVLQEFFIVDFKYKEKLNQLDEIHKSFLANKFGGWTQGDHEMFQHIYEHYNFHYCDLVNCNFTLRELIFDRIKRSLCEKSNDRNLERNEFLKHEEWTETNKYYLQQQKLIVNEWKEARKSLLLKAEAIFAEGFEMIEQQKIKREEKEKQLKICNELYEKVSYWRRQKFEALEIQQKIDDIIKKQDAEKTRLDNERKNKKRELEKQAIQDYKNRLDAHRKQMEEEERYRLEKLRDTLEEQTRKDQERIEYRKNIYLNKKKEAEQQKKAKQAENEIKEKRLENFFDSVKPQVENDPVRVIAYTEAYLRKRGVNPRSNDESSKFEDIKPLFNNFSFNDKQLNSDARLRIEARLRAAGLINNEYARSLIASIKPPSHPRRDQHSNSHWKGFRME